MDSHVEIEDRTKPRVWTQREVEGACRSLVLDFCRQTNAQLTYGQGLVLEGACFELVRSFMQEA